MRSNQTLPLWILVILSVLLVSSLKLYAQEFTVSEKITARFTGPFHFRFVFQPLVAIILGLRDGKTDAMLNKPPYIFHPINYEENRRNNIIAGFRPIAKTLIIGVLLDAIVQIYLFNSVRLWGALLVGALVVAFPYALARGIRNRLKKKSAPGNRPGFGRK